MYYWKIYLWENGKRSTDFTDNCIMPIFYEDKLDETLDTGKIILEKMPIETKNAFPPKTKFRLERHVKSDYSDTPITFDMVVDHDDVEEIVGVPEICTHRISLIEASVIAQGMHVDNIALTYELQDVDLNYKTAKTSDVKAVYNVSSEQPSLATATHSEDSFEYPITGTIIGGDGGLELA